MGLLDSVGIALWFIHMVVYVAALALSGVILGAAVFVLVRSVIRINSYNKQESEQRRSNTRR